LRLGGRAATDSPARTATASPPGGAGSQATTSGRWSTGGCSPPTSRAGTPG